MLPFGLDCIESVAAIEREACKLPEEAIRGGTVIVCCGSGVTLAGLIRACGRQPSRYIGVSSGRSVSMIRRCLSKYVREAGNVEIVPATHAYSEKLPGSCPFPSHPNYDQKAWDFLERNIRSLRPPILFWNVGAAGSGR
jgi:hypothetical protein